MENHHPIKWEGVTVIDCARTTKELLLKEAIYISLHRPPLDRGGGIELPRCWMAELKDAASRVGRKQSTISSGATSGNNCGSV